MSLILRLTQHPSHSSILCSRLAIKSQRKLSDFTAFDQSVVRRIFRTVTKVVVLVFKDSAVTMTTLNIRSYSPELVMKSSVCNVSSNDALKPGTQGMKSIVTHPRALLTPMSLRIGLTRTNHTLDKKLLWRTTAHHLHSRQQSPDSRVHHSGPARSQRPCTRST